MADKNDRTPMSIPDSGFKETLGPILQNRAEAGLPMESGDRRSISPPWRNLSKQLSGSQWETAVDPKNLDAIKAFLDALRKSHFS